MPIRIGKLCNYPSSLGTLAGWAHKEWYAQRDVPYKAVERDFERRMNSARPPMSFVALHGNIACGMVSLKIKDLLTRQDLSPWLSSLYVLPEYRKKGIGKSLISVVVREASILGYHRIFLFADHRDAEHLAEYYISLGWEFFSDAKDSFGNNVTIFAYNM